MSGTPSPRRGAGVIVYRTQPEGGQIRQEPWILGAPSLHRRIVVFVHGYNTYHDGACSSFLRMHDALWRRETRPVLSQIFWLFWPADTAGWKQIRSTLSYSWQVGKAADLAPHIDRWLRRLRDNPRRYPEEVIFVGHSLGCRLVLETVERLSRRSPAAPGSIPTPPPPRVAGIVLMAAAVPSDYCAGTERFGSVMVGRLRQTTGPAGLPPRELIMWSGHDWVLRSAFPLGQALAGENASQAVGRKGLPDGRWRRRYDAGYAHGDYWAKGGSADELMSALREADDDHEIAERRLPERPQPPDEQLPERHPPTWELGGLATLSRGAYLTR